LEKEKEMTSEVITLIQELGFPVAISVGLAFALYSVVRFILKEKVEDTLKRFDEKHENLQHRLDIIMDELGKLKKWNAEIKSDLKIYIDLVMRNK
jgi:predicted RNase H-like nuclease (RuvC/YqgF family)